jgi:peroxiredoxin
MLQKGLLFVFFSCYSFYSIAQGQPEGLFLGSKAPDFKTVDQFERPLHLRELAKKKPVLLLFYRGYWCPHCTRLLTRLQDSLSYFTEKGVTVVAVSPESKESQLKTLEKTKAGFSLVQDSALLISELYDVNYFLSDNQLARYRSGAIDLMKINHPNPAALPVPSLYVIGKDYTITYRFFDPEHKKKIHVAELIPLFQ